MQFLLMAAFPHPRHFLCSLLPGTRMVTVDHMEIVLAEAGHKNVFSDDMASMFRGHSCPLRLEKRQERLKHVAMPSLMPSNYPGALLPPALMISMPSTTAILVPGKRLHMSYYLCIISLLLREPKKRLHFVSGAVSLFFCLLHLCEDIQTANQDRSVILTLCECQEQ